MEASTSSLVKLCTDLKSRVDEFLGVMLPQLLSVTDDAFRTIASPLPSLTIDQQPTLISPTENLETGYEPKFSEFVSACDSIDLEFRRLTSQLNEHVIGLRRIEDQTHTDLLEDMRTHKVSLVKAIVKKNVLLRELMQSLIPVYLHVASMNKTSGDFSICSHEGVDSHFSVEEGTQNDPLVGDAFEDCINRGARSVIFSDPLNAELTSSEEMLHLRPSLTSNLPNRGS